MEAGVWVNGNIVKDGWWTRYRRYLAKSVIVIRHNKAGVSESREYNIIICI